MRTKRKERPRFSFPPSVSLRPTAPRPARACRTACSPSRESDTSRGSRPRGSSRVWRSPRTATRVRSMRPAHEKRLVHRTLSPQTVLVSAVPNSWLPSRVLGRICGFNVSVAHVWAKQEHQVAKAGHRMPVEDSYIAATARRYGFTIVTGNDQDFRRPGLKVLNPFTELPDTD